MLDPVRGVVRRLADVVCDEVNAKLAERDERLDRLEALIGVDAKYRRITEHSLHTLAYEYLATADETLVFQFAEDHELTIVEVRALMDDYMRSGR